MASKTREKSDQLWEMVYLLSVFSVDFHLIFFNNTHEASWTQPKSKIKKSKTNVEYISKHCQFLNGPKNRVLELNCTWNDWLTWTSSWRCYWRKARTPRLRLVLYVQLQLSQWWAPFESLPTAAVMLLIFYSLLQCLPACQALCNPVNGNKIKRDNLCTICVFPPKVIKRRWSCGWLGGRSPPLLAPRVSPPSACRQLVPIFLRILIC